MSAVACPPPIHESPLVASTPEYFGTHHDALHSYGGYAPNMPPSAAASMRRPPIGTSTTRRDYLHPILPTAAETTSYGNVFLGRSGFSVAKALHNPSSVEVLRAKRALAADFYNANSKLAATCTIPDDLQTETGERFHPSSLTHARCGLGANNAYWMHAPGSRDSGFTNCYTTISPVHWRPLDPTMDQLSRNEIRLNAASVSQTDYQPHGLVDYETSPIMGTIATRLTKGTGFNRARELHPCFLPEPCVYGTHTTSFFGDPSRFDTTYFHDYKHKTLACGTNGMPLLSGGHPKRLNSTSEQSPDFSLGCGAPRDFISETRQSYTNHWPLEGQRNFGLAFPISTVSSSGFVHSIKKHGLKSPRCGVPVECVDTSPQRYNPWPRFYLGHRTMLEKGFRPNPLTTGVDYSVTNSLPTTGSYAETYLY